MNPQFDSTNNIYKIDTKIEYDFDKGELNIDGLVNQAVQIRAGIEETAIRQAVIYELERLGYTVISPHG